jgi:hypothetical protein
VLSALSMEMEFTDPWRFNQRFWKTAICRFWVLGTCKRGTDCTFAHGQRELRGESSESVPAHVKAVRAEQDRIFEERRQEWRANQLRSCAKRGRSQSGSWRASAKRARSAKDLNSEDSSEQHDDKQVESVKDGGSESESIEENGAQTDGATFVKHVHEDGTETAKTSAGSAGTVASSSTSAPVQGIWARCRRPRPCSRRRTLRRRPTNHQQQRRVRCWPVGRR